MSAGMESARFSSSRRRHCCIEQMPIVADGQISTTAYIRMRSFQNVSMHGCTYSASPSAVVRLSAGADRNRLMGEPHSADAGSSCQQHVYLLSFTFGGGAGACRCRLPPLRMRVSR
jgi:hypothetical protein